MFGSVSSIKGKVHTKTFGVANYGSFEAFFNKLSTHYVDKKIILILDDARYHNTKTVKSLLNSL